MDWNAIWQDVISSTISGVLVIIFGGIIAWFAYITGIKGKEKDQKASERKNEIYIPLKYELKSLIGIRSNIFMFLLLYFVLPACTITFSFIFFISICSSIAFKSRSKLLSCVPRTTKII